MASWHYSKPGCSIDLDEVNTLAYKCEECMSWSSPKATLDRFHSIVEQLIDITKIGPITHRILCRKLVATDFAWKH